MKKFLTICLCAVMLCGIFLFSGCAKDENTLVLGLDASFAPMGFKDDNNEIVGFDIDVAREVCKRIGMNLECKEIIWAQNLSELNNKSIDCVWNGMTLTDEVTSAMECSKAYCNNAQIVIVPADKADQYQDVDSLKDLTFAVEAGSAGEDQVKELGLDYTPVKAQADTLTEVKAGTSDAAVIDSLMAAAMVGEGTGYADLTYTIGLNSEEYGVGFRKGSDLAAALNDFFANSYKDGSMLECAEKYGVQAAIIAQ